LKAHAETLEKEATLPFFETRAGRVLREHYKDTFGHLQALLRAETDALLAKEGKDNVILRTLFNRFTELYDFCGRLSEACECSFAELKALLDTYRLPESASCPRGHEYTAEETAFKNRLSETNTQLQAIRKALAWDDENLAYAFRETARITRSVYLLLSALDERLTAEKRRRAIFDYDDITAFAYRLLCQETGEPTPLALEFRASFDAICVDEYQDVNAAQHKIFEVISTERNRFMVGDIKQSIYAFRGAVPDFFKDLRSSFPPAEANAASAVLYLTRNFRSEEPVIAFANGVFDFLFHIIEKSIGYRDEDRLATEKTRDEKHILPTVSLLLKESTSRKGSEEEGDEDAESGEEATKNEDDRIADTVLLLLKEGKLHDGSPIKPSDIAILSYDYPYSLIETLRARGIPLKTKDKTDFFSRKEILLALSLCHAINNPHRDIYLAAILRSPLYGFTLDELVALRDTEKKEDLYVSLCAYREKHPACKKAARVIDDLSRFRAMAENMPSHRLIRAVFDEVGIYATADSAGRASLRAFYELARSYESTAFCGLYRFLDRVNEMRKYGGGLSDAEVGQKEAVTVSTIHASKGLEYPVCILAHTGKSMKKANKSPFLFSEKQGLAFAITDKTGRALLSTPILTALSLQKGKGEIEEAVRVLYVALTRPREQLYIFCSTAKKLTKTLEREAALLRLAPSPIALYTYASFATWILAALPSIPSDHKLIRIAESDVSDVLLSPSETPKESAATHKTDEQKTAALCKMYSERFAFRYPHEAETRLAAKFSVSSLHPDMLDEKREAPSDEEEAVPSTLPAFLKETKDGDAKTKSDAAKAGTATHLFLQFCEIKKILTTDGCHSDIIDKELSRLHSQGFITEEDVRLVRKDELCAFLSSDLAEEIRRAKTMYREFRFHASLPAEKFTQTQKEDVRDVSLFLQGVADLILLREDGSLLLVDYKTDRIPRGTKKEDVAKFLFDRHGTQLSVYAHALREIFGKEPDVAIYSLPLGKLLTPPKVKENIYDL